MIRNIGFTVSSFCCLMYAPLLFAIESEKPEAGVTVLSRGPIHEAFAQPTTAPPDPAPEVPKAPPDPIPEEPPDQKPEGANVQWIPGYWSWDGDKKDWLWVSGFWRNTPPGRQWVPGHWVKADDGWRWVAGFWASAARREINYQDAPPASLENGPASAAPDDESIYIPGVWVYRDGRFLWRPGYWLTCRPGWTWSAAHYVWTPRGYVYVDGYWDYPLEDRGCLFAPVVFNEPLWTTPGWCYRPRFVLNVGSLWDCLFVRAGWNSYCFGDYYGPAWAKLGFSPWFTFGTHCHDPLYGYYGWANRNNSHWATDLRATHDGRVNGDLSRPPTTFAAQTAGKTSTSLVTPLAQVASVGKAKITTLNSNQLADHTRSVSQFRDLAGQRAKTESSQGTVKTSALQLPGHGSADPAGGRSAEPAGRSAVIKSSGPVSNHQSGPTITTSQARWFIPASPRSFIPARPPRTFIRRRRQSMWHRWEAEAAAGASEEEVTGAAAGVTGAAEATAAGVMAAEVTAATGSKPTQQ